MANFKKLAAPFPGIITVRTMDAGTLITAGSSREIFRLARTDPLRVYVSLPQAYSQMVKTNDEAVADLFRTARPELHRQSGPHGGRD